MPNSRVRERFAPREAAEVLQRIGSDRLGAIHRVVEFNRGSSRSPKLIVESARGRWLVKRRAPVNAAPERVRFCHHLQRMLASALVPVTAPRPFSDGSTALVLGERVYEYFDFIDGDRYGRTAEHAHAAGRALGRLLVEAASAVPDGDAVHGTFHASGVMLGAARLAEQSIALAEPETDIGEVAREAKALRDLYRRAAELAMRSGFAAMCVQPIHGDFHPGNLIFREGHVVAIVDFDAARIEPRAVEVANALLQVGSRRLPGQEVDAWPADMDPALVDAMVAGVRSGGVQLESEERQAIPWLMIEACIAEGVVPIARTGSFADLRGSAMLRFLHRRAAWLESSAESLLAVFSS